MKKFAMIMVFFFFCFLSWAHAPLAGKDGFSTKPSTNQGKKWRIGYYEGGEYLNYQQVLMATVRALMNLGWIQPTDIPDQKGEQTKELWQWLAANAHSASLEFVPDAHYSAQWDEKMRPQVAKEIINRLTTKKDIDLMIAMGTWAGKDLATPLHQTPTVVLSTSDPISAGIIKSAEDSGLPHVHAHVDPDRWERQIRLFHEIIKFKKLGVAYENTVSGKSYAALDVIERLAAEKKFEVVHCHTKSDIASTEEASKSVIACFDTLSNTADAIYVTEQGGINNKSIPELVRLVNAKHLPTFAQYGSEMVQYGFLMSTSTAGYRYVAAFHAETIAKILNGARPGQLNQVFREPPKIAINLKTAEIIGYDPPLVILGAADEIFHEITVPGVLQ